VVYHELPLTFHGFLGNLKDLFDMDYIGLIEIASCDGMEIGRLVSSLDHDVAYLRVEGVHRWCLIQEDEC